MAHQNQLYRMPMDEGLRQAMENAEDRILHHINELVHRINEASRMGINFNVIDNGQLIGYYPALHHIDEPTEAEGTLTQGDIETVIEHMQNQHNAMYSSAYDSAIPSGRLTVWEMVLHQHRINCRLSQEEIEPQFDNNDPCYDPSLNEPYEVPLLEPGVHEQINYSQIAETHEAQLIRLIDMDAREVAQHSLMRDKKNSFITQELAEQFCTEYRNPGSDAPVFTDLYWQEINDHRKSGDWYVFRIPTDKHFMPLELHALPEFNEFIRRLAKDTGEHEDYITVPFGVRESWRCWHNWVMNLPMGAVPPKEFPMIQVGEQIVIAEPERYKVYQILGRRGRYFIVQDLWFQGQQAIVLHPGKEVYILLQRIDELEFQ
ncbi:hypothetical protein AM1_B0171 (plasmid) [Acaryochloris marina MBIC11017]|uniref:Uncharacterized protein n=2 Tax=Acaryochloris marina TaxID=155978 RepID=A8ZL66_ACAM1|nr:hypothetical protein AM1_B0171 [Acaryochloris marina MBIC11017]